MNLNEKGAELAQVLAEAAQNPAGDISRDRAFKRIPAEVAALGFDALADLITVISDQARIESHADEDKSREIVNLTGEIADHLRRLDALLLAARNR